MSSSDQKTANIMIDETSTPVKRLKAGKFYEAQKVFVELIGAAGKPKDLSSGKTSEIDPSQVMNLFNVMPRKMAEFVAICIDMPADELLEKAYPSEIPAAFSVCYKLNNILDSLKNYQSHMEVIGGPVEQVKTQVNPPVKTQGQK